MHCANVYIHILCVKLGLNSIKFYSALYIILLFESWCYPAGFEVLGAVALNSCNFYFTTPCFPYKVYDMLEESVASMFRVGE
jgi:hypothetical protein